MWPKPSRKKGKSQGTKSRLKAIKEEKSEKTEDSREQSRSERRKTRPPNRNRKKAGELEKRKDRKKQDTKARLKAQTKKNKEPVEEKKEEVIPEVLEQVEGNVKQHESELGTVWKDKILSAYKGSPKNSQGLLASVPKKKAQFEAGERQKLELINESMIKVVDKMFDNFQNTAYGFNQVTQGSDLELVWIRPSLVTESSGNWTEGSGDMKIFSGRISTRYWTLVIRGSVNSIVAFILPADKLLSFGSSVFDFDPYAELIPESDGMSVNWLVKDKVISQDLFPSVFRALLDGLIRYANEEAEPNESFRLEDIGFAPEPVVEEPEPQVKLDENEPELLSTHEPPDNQQQPPVSPPEPMSPPEAMVQKQRAKTVEMDRKPLRKPQVELAIEDAFELASHKANEERLARQKDMVDPGAGFIESVSSQLANQATQEIDKLRESITSDAAAAPRDEQGIESTGQWKLVGSNLPPAVASQWQNYVQKTGDEAGVGQGDSTPSAPEPPSDDQWNSFDTEQMPEAVQRQFQQNQVPVDQSQVQSQDSGAWVHPSQRIADAQAQYSQQQSQPSGNVVPQAPQSPGQDAAYDQEEAKEFNTNSGLSQYLLTENDIDDRAIQTPPPEPDVGPAQAVQESPWAAPEPEPEPVTYEIDEDDETFIEETEESVEYEEEESEQYEYEEHTYELPSRSGDLVGALSEVVTTIDLKVEILSQKGAEAFSNKDFKRAEVIIKLSERLNDFKEEANTLLSILGEESE